MADKMIDIKISSETLSIDEAYNSVLDLQCGGVVLFIGTVRNQNKGESVTHLDFESYEPMARKVMTAIAEECIEKFTANNIVIHHRTGHVGLKEIAVIIAVSTVHRESAFEACEYAIDQLKDRVPIWKKEFLENGSYWVNSRP